VEKRKTIALKKGRGGWENVAAGGMKESSPQKKGSSNHATVGGKGIVKEREGGTRSTSTRKRKSYGRDGKEKCFVIRKREGKKGQAKCCADREKKGTG